MEEMFKSMAINIKNRLIEMFKERKIEFAKDINRIVDPYIN